jgi:hypothetical protein
MARRPRFTKKSSTSLPGLRSWGELLGVFTIASGYPLYVAYRRLKWASPPAYALGGAIFPVLFYLLPELLPTSGRFTFSTAYCDAIIDNVRTPCGWDLFYQDLAMNAVYGALAGLIFWALLWRRPIHVSPE